MATAADLAGHMQNWLARNGFPVRQYSMSEGDAFGNAAVASPGQVVIDPKYAREVNSVAARLGKRGRISPAQLSGLQTLMHESLHQMRFGRDPGVIGTDGLKPGSPQWFEEGGTEAVTQDLLPIFARQMYGDTLSDKSISLYDDPVRNVRQLSVFGSGAKNYRERGARVWRRSFLHADADGRSDMVAKAQQARVKWGERTGR